MGHSGTVAQVESLSVWDNAPDEIVPKGQKMGTLNFKLSQWDKKIFMFVPFGQFMPYICRNLQINLNVMPVY